MNSIELTKALHKRGYLSKEAAVEVLRERDRLVKEALYNASLAFFKEAGISDFLKRLRVGGKTPLRAPPKPKGWKPGDPVPQGVGPAWSDVGANLTKILALAGLTSASAAGIEAIQEGRRAKKLNKEIELSYKRLSKEQPRISEIDPGKVRTHFGILARYAPSLAANPTVASAFVVESALRRGVIDPSTIKSLAETQNKIDNIGYRDSKLPFGAATSLAQSAMAGAGGG